MEVIFDYLPEFEKRAKELAKKYKSVKTDYSLLLDELEKNPFGGEALGHHTFKYRMAISSKGKGKSGGARVITYNMKEDGERRIVITLMTIYDKSVINNVSDAYLRSLVQLVEHK